MQEKEPQVTEFVTLPGFFLVTGNLSRSTGGMKSTIPQTTVIPQVFK